MAKQKTTPQKSAAGGLASYRREVIACIPRKFLASLTPEQRQFLGYTPGNPHVENAVFRLVAALVRAESVLNRFRQAIDRQKEIERQREL